MSGWSGGFGDDLDVQEVIEQHEPWLARNSRSLLPVTDPDVEDVAQEGRIAIWKALETYDPSRGPVEAWVQSHARWRMKTVRGNRVWTGHDSSTRPTMGGRPAVIQSIGYLSDMLGDQASVDNMLQAADLLAAAEWAYHHGEIAAAMADLTPRQREYVYIRFWLNYQATDRALYFGYDPDGGLWNASNGAKARLRGRLAHLVAV